MVGKERLTIHNDNYTTKGGDMKSEKEVRDFLKELRERSSGSANMNYEKGGAAAALEWVLGDKEFKPVIGHR